MGLFSNPLGHAGYPPNPQYATTVNSTVRAATAAESAAGTVTDAYISPATAQSSVVLDFASPPPMGSTTPNTGVFTTLSATTEVGFFGETPVVQQTQAATTNNIASGGTANTFANYTDLSTYATDAATIRNNLYQLAETLGNVVAILRTYGLAG